MKHIRFENLANELLEDSLEYMVEIIYNNNTSQIVNQEDYMIMKSFITKLSLSIFRIKHVLPDSKDCVLHLQESTRISVEYSQFLQSIRHKFDNHTYLYTRLNERFEELQLKLLSLRSFVNSYNSYQDPLFLKNA